MKKHFYKLMSPILSIILVLTLFSPVFGSAIVNDYSTHWANEHIQSAIKDGIVSGYPDGAFKPDSPITRAEFMSIVNNRFSFTGESEATYSDVSLTAWFALIVAKAKAAGYITGYPDGSMHPNQYISRQEAAVILGRLLSFKEVASTSGYTDSASIANWSKDSIIALNEVEIMMGYPDHSFRPEAQIERAEALVAIQKSFNYQLTQTDPKETVAVNTISADQATLSLVANGQTGLIRIVITPTDATNKSISWTTSNSDVATVSNGIVTPLAKGTVVITATSDADQSIKSTVTVTVAAAGQVIDKPLVEPVHLGSAGDFVILTKTGISTVPTSNIVGNIGVSPIHAAAITGFSLTADSTNVFSTSDQVTGKIYASDYAVPTPSNLTTAVSNMEAAYTDAAGRAADYTELYAGDISGKTLTPGVYKWGTGVLMTSDVTLNGGPNDIWIFQISEGITQANGTKIILAGGAKAKNIFWQAAETVTIGTDSHFEGIILCQTNITLGNHASINGRLYAQTAVTLDASSVIKP